jgi:hypothetical protein
MITEQDSCLSSVSCRKGCPIFNTINGLNHCPSIHFKSFLEDIETIPQLGAQMKMWNALIKYILYLLTILYFNLNLLLFCPGNVNAVVWL